MPVWTHEFVGNSVPLQVDEKHPNRAVEELHQVAATSTERRQTSHVNVSDRARA